MWLFKQAQLDVVILEVGLGGRLDATNIVDADVAVVTSIALDHTDWLGPDRESIGREKAGIFRSENRQLSVSRKCLLPLLMWGRKKVHCYNVGALSGTIPSPIMTGRLAMLTARWKICRCRLSRNRMPQRRWRHCASGLEVSENAIRDGIASAILPGRFQIVSESPRVIFDVAHNPHAAEYLTGRMKALPKNGRVLAVIGMLHDKDIAGTLAWLKSVVDDWYCAPLEGPRGATAEQLLEHLGNGKSFDSVAQAWDAAMADAKAEDTVLVCGSFHTVAHVMEVIDARRSGGK